MASTTTALSGGAASAATDEVLKLKAGAEAVEQSNLLAEAFGFAAEHRFYLRKAIQQGDLESALRHSLSLANELRSSQLMPQNYYKLYAVVFWELQHLAAFVQDTERHGFNLEEVYEIVQYEGNALSRLYMLATVGMVRMLAPGESPDEILADLSDMLCAVQHPVRGLFLRYYLLQVVKEKLLRLRSGISGALKFLLNNFKESASLWQRLRLQGKPDRGGAVPESEAEAWLLDDRRYSLRLLVCAHLMQIARLEGLTVDLYAEAVMPEVLRLTTACEDPAGQAYLLQSFIEVFPDDFHIDTLDRVLAACAQVHWTVDLQPLLQHIIRRLTARLTGGATDGGAESSGRATVDAFGLFHAHLKQLHSRPRTAATPLASLLSLQLELCMSALALHPGDAKCMELLLQGTVELLDSRSNSEPLATNLAEAVVDIMAAPLTQEPLVPEVLAMPYHEALLASVGRPMQRRAALAIVSAVLAGDVGLCDCETLRRLFSLADTLLRDEGGSELEDEEDLVRHLEHDPAAFTAEQEAVARLVHQVRHEDPSTVFQMLSLLREYFVQGGPHRIVFTMPAMVVAMLRLVGQLARGEGQNQLHDECVSLLDVFQCTQEMCASLRALAPKECLRLWLLCAASADRAAAAAAEENVELIKVCSSFVDSALSCLFNDVKGQEAQLCGLQLLVGTLRQMSAGLEESQLNAACNRAVDFCCKLPAKRFQSKALCLCSELFWFPRGKSQDASRGLLCLKKALQCADGAIHIDPLDITLFVDILNQAAHLFAERADQVSASVLSRLLALCVQQTKYIEARVPDESVRALHAAVSALQEKQREAAEALMTGDAGSPDLNVDLRPAEQLPPVPSLVEAKS